MVRCFDAWRLVLGYGSCSCFLKVDGAGSDYSSDTTVCELPLGVCAATKSLKYLPSSTDIETESFEHLINGTIDPHALHSDFWNSVWKNGAFTNKFVNFKDDGFESFIETLPIGSFESL
jgi:hypothetical protein